MLRQNSTSKLDSKPHYSSQPTEQTTKIILFPLPITPPPPHLTPFPGDMPVSILCVCVCVCACVRACVRACARVCVRACVRARVCVYVCECACVRARAPIITCVETHLLRQARGLCRCHCNVKTIYTCQCCFREPIIKGPGSVQSLSLIHI